MASSVATMGEANPTPPADKVLSPAFVIGIAGASSSGKTMLSLILAEIFEKATAKGDPAENPVVKIFAQDDYFLPKSDCPKRSFRPRLGDEQVVMGHVSDEGKVEAADSDCLAAVDWVRLHADIQGFIKGDATSSTTKSASAAHASEVAKYRKNTDFVIRPSEFERLVKEVQDCVGDQILFNLSDEYEGNIFKDAGPQGGDLLNCRIAIVEGFLLFSREKPPAKCEASPLTPKQQQVFDHLQQQVLQQRPRPLGGSPKASHEAISSLLDLRLYLQVPTELACRRRFSREPYMDPPRGTRMKGEMWKTVGYYFDVARANFYSYDILPMSMVTQLLQGNMVFKNAVRNVLLQMELKEQENRYRVLDQRAAMEEQKERAEDQAAMASLIKDLHFSP